MADEHDGLNADPFAVLGVAEAAGDEAIRRRYLALVRAYPPDRAPERFQAYRRAYEAISGPRERMAAKLLHASGGALARLKRHCLEQTAEASGRASVRAVTALIADGLKQAPTD
jgi:curved DNA-binding protein CbpA